MEKTKNTTKKVTTEKENTVKEDMSYDMVEITKTDVTSGNEVTLKLPKNFIYMGAIYNGNFDEEFEFCGNKAQGRTGKVRELAFTVTMIEEITSVSIKAINDKYKAIALLKTVERAGKQKQQCASVNIVSMDGKNWVLANGKPFSAIDVIGTILHVTSWNTANNWYKNLVNRNDRKSSVCKVTKQKNKFAL